MNLQINSPYTKCPYRCPYCVAGVTNDYPFSDDLYENDKERYINKLCDIIQEYHITTVVLTGSTEPTLFPGWIEEICDVLRVFDIHVELQTKNYKWTKTYDTIDVIAYSHDAIPTYEREPIHKCQVRDVFLWNQALTAEAIIEYFKNQQYVNQVTIKKLVPSSYNNEAIDAHIETITKELTRQDIAMFKENNAWVDDDCSASEGRYIIYRTDGGIYQRWSDMVPIG